MPRPNVVEAGAESPVVTIVHTSFLAVESLTDLFQEIGPDVELRHIVDDGLLDDVIAEGGVSEPVRTRLLDHFRQAANAGCDVLFSQCSSVGEIAEEAGSLVAVPVVRIDEPMAREACREGSRIGVVATLETTLGPTRRLVESAGRAAGVAVTIEECLVEGAFAQLEAGARDAHDDLVLDAVSELSARVDVVVCAQGSMAAIVPRLARTEVRGGAEARVPRARILTSPRSGVARAVELARERASERSP